MENIKDILATLRVETRRVAVRSTIWLGHWRRICDHLETAEKALAGTGEHMLSGVAEDIMFASRASKAMALGKNMDKPSPDDET